MSERKCEMMCDAPAVWRWNPLDRDSVYLCDDHAALEDLDELEAL